MKDPGDMFAEASAIIDNLPVLHAIAAELEASRQCMEQLGMTLCLDPNLVRSHLPALQKLDELGQRQFCLAQVLRAADMRTAMAHIPLDALRDRMAEHVQGQEQN
jgi:hypothetical protein